MRPCLAHSVWLAAALAVAACSSEPAPLPPAQPVVVENVSRGPVGDGLPHLAPRDPAGVGAYSEPYRYLEDDADPRTVVWRNEQLEFSRRFIDRLPLRTEIAPELAAEIGHAVGTVTQLGASTFYTWTSQPGAHLGLLSPGRSPREIAVPGADLLSAVAPSPSGRLLSVQSAGRAGVKTRVVDVERGPVEPPGEAWLPKWAPDERSFFYLRATHRGVVPSIARHVIGEPPSADRTVFGAGTESDALLRDWTAESNVSFEVGQRTLAVVIRRGALPGVYRAPDQPPVFTVAVASLDALATSAAPFRHFDASKAALVIPEPDDSLLVATWVAHKLRITRAALVGSGSTLLADDAPKEARMVKASDALYFVNDDSVVRQASATAGRETFPLPGRLASVDGNALTPGLRLHVTSITRGGWFSLDAKTGLERMVFDAPQPELEGAVEEVTPIDLGGVPGRLTVIHARDAKRDGSHPALLLQITQMSPQVQIKSWLSRGGVLAVCQRTSPQTAAASEDLARQQASSSHQCAVAIKQSGWSSAVGLVGGEFGPAELVREAASNPGLYGALIVEALGGFAVSLRSLPTLSGLPPQKAPDLDFDATGLPPMLVFTGADRSARSLAWKMVAKVNAENRDRPAALWLEHGQSFSDDQAREQAFLFLALTGRGKDQLPNFVRRDDESARPAR